MPDIKDTLRPRRLAFVVFQAGAQADGGLNSITELIEQIVFSNFAVVVFTNSESIYTNTWKSIGCDVVVLSMPESRFHEDKKNKLGRLGRFYQRLKNNFVVYRYLKSSPVYAIHANDTRSFWTSVFAARWAGTPIILNVRDALPPQIKKAPIHWRLAYALCDQLLVLSGEMEHYWRNLLGVEVGGKVSHLYSIVRTLPVDLQEDGRQRERSSLGFGSETYVIAYVASFHPKKLQSQFLEHAAAPILAKFPQAQIVFVGDCNPSENPAAARAVAAARRLNAGDRISFAGFSSEPWRWYVASDLIVLASEREGLPRCLIESLCYGTPFASFAVSSARELADLSGAGSVAPLGDYSTLVEAVDERYRLRAEDAAARSDRAAAARVRFDADAARDGYIALLRELAP